MPYINVSVERTNYTPVALEEVLRVVREQAELAGVTP